MGRSSLTSPSKTKKKKKRKPCNELKKFPVILHNRQPSSRVLHAWQRLLRLTGSGLTEHLLNESGKQAAEAVLAKPSEQ